MADMSMNKVIHGAIRRDLGRFSKALTSFPAGNNHRAQQLQAAWSNFDYELTYHHEGEHTIAWPALRAVGASSELLSTLDTEHDAMAAALAKVRAAIADLARTASSDDASTALAALEQLELVTSEHLDHEEAELEGLYLVKRDTPEMKAMGKAFGKVSPMRGGHFFAWLLDGASAEEESAVKSEVPGPVVTIMSGLFGRRYRKNIATVWTT